MGSHARKWYGSYSHKAIHYVVKMKIGGVTGLVVRLVGKQPPDTQAWVLGDDAPAFVNQTVLCTGTGLFGGWNSLFLLSGRIARLRYVLRNSAATSQLTLRRYLQGSERTVEDNVIVKSRRVSVHGGGI